MASRLLFAFVAGAFLQCAHASSDFKCILNKLHGTQSATHLIRSDLIPPVTRLLEEGPNRWVELPTHPQGKWTFQRGLSGNMGDLKTALEEAFNLLSGKPEAYDRSVTFVASPAFSDSIASRVNSFFSRPLTIRGRTDSFLRTRNPLHTVTPTLAGSLKNAELTSIPVGRRPGETQNLASGYTIDKIESIAAFMPSFENSQRPNPAGNAQRAKDWATAYVHFYDSALSAGLHPKTQSRGYRFYSELKSALAHKDLGVAGTVLSILERYRTQ